MPAPFDFSREIVIYIEVPSRSKTMAVFPKPSVSILPAREGFVKGSSGTAGVWLEECTIMILLLKSVA
jgi:hypothetical protein